MFAVCNWRRAKREREHLVISLWHLEILVRFFSELRICLLFDVWYAAAREPDRAEKFRRRKKPRKQWGTTI
jgi:hypothetical protein